MPIRVGDSYRFTADDYPIGSAQRAIAESTEKWRAAERGTAPPTALQILAGDTDYTRRLNARVENAWRDPDKGDGS